MATATAASLASISALAAYINAKYHIGQDLNSKSSTRASNRHYTYLAKQNRLSLWYDFAEHARTNSNKLCVWSRTGSYTWSQVHDRAAQWATFLISKNIKPGDLVAVYLINSAEFPVIWLALWCIGCAPALLNYNLKGDALLHCLRISGAKMILVDADEEVKSRYDQVESAIADSGVEGHVVTDSLMEKVCSGPANVPDDIFRHQVGGKNPVYHSKLPFGQTFADRWYSSMPLFHGTGGLALMAALTSGLSIAVGRKFSVHKHWDDIHDSEATAFVYVGEAARYLLNAPPHPLERKHKLKRMYGNGMRPDVWSRFKERFNVPQVIEFFNSTEGVFGLHIHSLNSYTQDCVGQHGALLRWETRDTYVPAAIDPESGALVRDSRTGLVVRNSYYEGGEILVKVPDESAFAGYINNPAATAKKFERNVLKKGDLYYRSGDSLRRDDDGRWFFLDRLGDTFRWKSENVSTAQVAEVLGKYPGVAEATVYGVLVPQHDGRAGCAAVLLSDGVTLETFDWSAFLAYARQNLVKEAVPVFVRVVENSSRTDNEKQNKGPLKDEGIAIARFGEKLVGGEGDVMMWLRPGSHTYERFGLKELESIKAGKVTI